MKLIIFIHACLLQGSVRTCSTRRCFTHVLSLTFASPDDLTSYLSHERHAAFAGTFMAALEKVVVIAKPPPARSDEASDLI
jgi:hypothetical protein